MKIKILLVDDHKIFLDGIRSLLSEIDDFEIVGLAISGESAIEMLNSINPDIIITDITMKEMSGLDLCKIVKEKFPEINIIILSMHTNEEFVLNAVKSGASGYLPKDTSIKELKDAIKIISDGGQYFSKNISEYFFMNYINRVRQEHVLIENEKLTQREIEVLKLIAGGFTNKEIADKLFISVKTVDTHKNHLMQKLKCKNSAEMVLFAIKNKLVTLE